MFRFPWLSSGDTQEVREDFWAGYQRQLGPSGTPGAWREVLVSMTCTHHSSKVESAKGLLILCLLWLSP